MSVSTHVPKPHTPFQWAAMDSEAEIARKQALLAEPAARRCASTSRCTRTTSRIEGIFSRGDRRAGRRARARRSAWAPLRRLGRAAAPRRCGSRRSPSTSASTSTSATSARIPVDRAAALGPHRRRPRGRLPGQGVPQGAQGSAVAPVRQAVQAAAAPEQRRGRRGRRAARSWSATTAASPATSTGMKEERLYFLRRMNAWTPPPPPPPPARGPRGRSERRGTRSRPPPDAHRAGRRRGATGCATPSSAGVAYLGHLDLIRHLPRIFRRAGLELYYSVGFHPKPELTLRPGAGARHPVAGRAARRQAQSTTSSRSELRAAAPRGSRSTASSSSSAVRLGDDDRALGRVLSRAEFAALLPAGVDVRDGARARFAGRRRCSWCARVRRGRRKVHRAHASTCGAVAATVEPALAAEARATLRRAPRLARRRRCSASGWSSATRAAPAPSR